MQILTAIGKFFEEDLCFESFLLTIDERLSMQLRSGKFTSHLALLYDQ